MIKALIIDDDPKCRAAIKKLLPSLKVSIAILGEGANADEGRDLITAHSPDLVFLDVEMPGKSGFDLLNELHAINFEIIFTTAYDKYAIQAIKSSALDFLLKPVTIEDLEDAINRYQEKTAKTNVRNQVELLLKNYGASAHGTKRIAIPTMEGLEFIECGDIVRIEAEGSYTRISLKDDSPLLVSKSLKEMEELITASNFFRVHYSHLVNTSFVKKYHKADAMIIMTDGSQVPVSRHRKEEFLERLKHT